MKKRILKRIIAVLLILGALPVHSALAWTDQAHMAMGLAAGFKAFHNCAAADVSHTVAKANSITQTDEKAHYFNAPLDYALTADDVYGQLQYIGMPREECPGGYLLGAILGTARLCKEKTEAGAYDDEYYAVLLHYVGDLAMPLHMTVYDDFNRANHFACDDILSDKEAEYPVLAAMALAEELTVDDDVRIETEEQLVEAVVELAKQSQQLGRTLRDENRIITREEALVQVSRAATLGRAIMKYCNKVE